MLDIEVQLGDFISPTRRNDYEPEPKREPRLEIDPVHLARVVGHDEARAPDLRHYLIGNAADTVCVVETQGLKPSGAYPWIK
jgi:hypothetical protein